MLAPFFSKQNLYHPDILLLFLVFRLISLPILVFTVLPVLIISPIKLLPSSDSFSRSLSLDLSRCRSLCPPSFPSLPRPRWSSSSSPAPPSPTTDDGDGDSHDDGDDGDGDGDDDGDGGDGDGDSNEDGDGDDGVQLYLMIGWCF